MSLHNLVKYECQKTGDNLKYVDDDRLTAFDPGQPG